MVPFLTEWLINYGTDPSNLNNLFLLSNGQYLALIVKAERLGYLSIDPPDNTSYYITKAGLKYLQEQQI